MQAEMIEVANWKFSEAIGVNHRLLFFVCDTKIVFILYNSVAILLQICTS
jgi:hypothetical protein